MSILITKAELLKKIANGDLEDLLNSNDHIIIGETYRFKKNIYWCDFRKGLFFLNTNQEVKITATQKRIVEYFIMRHNEILEIEDIEKHIWKNKRTSIFTLRNMIKQIRDKTYYDFIKSKPSQGYVLDKILTDKSEVKPTVRKKKEKIVNEDFESRIKRLEEKIEKIEKSKE